MPAAGTLAAIIHTENHAIARREARHSTTDTLDDTGTLMSEDDRFRATIPLVNVDVGMTDAARDDPHEYLAVARLLDIQRLHRRWARGIT
jgi:hypothetical protein